MKNKVFHLNAEFIVKTVDFEECAEFIVKTGTFAQKLKPVEAGDQIHCKNLCFYSKVVKFIVKTDVFIRGIKTYNSL